MVTQNDLFQSTEDAQLAERLMQLDISKNFQGMFRTPNQYVNSDRIAEVLASEVGTRNIIEFCVTTLERRNGN
jgi:hypothetical protein